jgi:outer membrane immunogenic protein
VKAPPPAPPPPTWTGFYIGANGGWAWANNINDATTWATTAPALRVAATGVAFDQHPNGAMFGGQIGYNWQWWTNWVFGVEGDFDGANIRNSRDALTNGFQGLGPASVGAFQDEKVEWLATLRARLGYTWGPSLFYVTGGGAWERVDFRGSGFINASPVFAAPLSVSATDFDQTKSGWVAGVGYEYMITPNWTIRGEYLHYGFSNNTVTTSAINTAVVGGGTSTITQTWKVPNIDAVRVGVNFKFF